MDAQDFRSLQEAYMEVVENQQLDEAQIMKHQQLMKGHKAISKNKLPKGSGKSEIRIASEIRRQTNQSPKKLRKSGALPENYDLYDIILSYLLDEGYAETPEAAEAIMVNMSEEWRQSIIG